MASTILRSLYKLKIYNLLKDFICLFYISSLSDGGRLIEWSLLIVNGCAICPFRLCGPEIGGREGKTAKGTLKQS